MSPSSEPGGGSPWSLPTNPSVFRYRDEESPPNYEQHFACFDLGDGRLIKTEVLYNENARRQFAPQGGYQLFERTYPLPQCHPALVGYNRYVHPEPQTSYGAPGSDFLQNIRDDSTPNLPNLTELNHYNMHSTSDNQINEFINDWRNNSVGTYDPFGCNFLRTEPSYNQNPILQNTEQNFEPEVLKDSHIEHVINKEPEVHYTPEIIIPPKKRIVAEVKPMRPSYSAVLSKTPKVSESIEIESLKKNDKENLKIPLLKSSSTKTDKSRSFNNEKGFNEEKLKKTENERKKQIRIQPCFGGEYSENNEGFTKSEFISDCEKNEEKYNMINDLSNNINMSKAIFDSNAETIINDSITDKMKRKTKKNTNNISSEKFLEDEDFSKSEENSENIIYKDNPVEKTKKKKDSKYNNLRSGTKNVEKNKRNNTIKPKKGKGNEYIHIIKTHFDSWIAFVFCVVFNFCHWFYNLIIDICQMSAHLSYDLISQLYKEIHAQYSKISIIIKEKVSNSNWIKKVGMYIDNKYGHTRLGFWRKIKWFKYKSESETENQKKNYSNIPLPSTGDDAMKRLLACKGKDPYSILGVGVHCTDDDIKRYYRRQAFLVHPDKNPQAGAEEAFKILQHAFDMIGEPERREAYEQRVLENKHVEAARSELADLVARLQEKVKKAASTIHCSGCSRGHPRTLTNRPSYAARYCSQCNIRHSAKEGDIWAESTCWGFLWIYYACMDGAIYQINQWASCQKKNLKHVKANAHHVQCKIVFGNKSHGNMGRNINNINDADLEDFLNNLYSKTNPQASNNQGKPTSNPQPSDFMKNRRKNKKPK